MTATEPYALNDRFLADEGTVFLTGIQALARLPLEQLRADGRRGWRTASFVSGYPGSPLGGYDGTVATAARLAPELTIVTEPGLNEELAASAVMGSQLAVLQPDCVYEGVIGIWYGKAPGVERAADALRHAVFAGTSTRGGAIALVGDDPNAKSSTVPSSSAGLLSDMHMPLLYPGDPAEALDLGRHGIALSRTTGLWSAMKIVADVADATGTVVLDPDRIDPVIPLVDGERYRHTPDGRLLTPHTLELEQEIVEVRYELAREYAAANKLNQVTVNPGDAWIGIVASGITYREVREAFSRLGLDTEDAIAAAGVRLLKMGMPLPFRVATITEFARGLSEVFVIEEKQPNIESLIKDALYPQADRPLVVGKFDHHGAALVPQWGALDADRILPLLRRRLARRIDESRLAPAPPARRPLIPLEVDRTPFFCSGCPHNRSTRAPDGALIGAGIGCHTMTLLMDEDRVGDIACVTAMGGEGMPWVGMSPFLERGHFVQNLGDGTYFHSGQLAIQAAVAAGVNITYKLLYNSTVAMTGGQDPAGQLGVPEVAQNLLTQGVARVLVTTDDVARYRGVSLPAGVDVWDRSRLSDAHDALAEVPGVTVLIHDQRCAAELRRDRKRGTVPTPGRRVVINARICEGCGHCGEISNCLSVQPMDTVFGPKTHIDQTTCNFDYSCLEGDCPSFMTVVPRPRRRVSRLFRRGVEPVLEPDGSTDRTAGDAVAVPVSLPEPELVVPADDFALRITGIGGTGVVTVAQVLGTAAMLDGFHVRGLDQIGLSQKAGPVVSDVRLSRAKPTATNRLGQGQADLLLAFDQLVAASDRGLLTTSADRTAVVGSTTVTPTGEMITNTRVLQPTASELATRIGLTTRTDHHHWADAQAVTNDLFGTSTTANMFVIGMAYQAGCLPIGGEALEQAIALNGVAVQANIDAFGWGRAQVHRPDLVEQRRHTAEDGHDASSVALPAWLATGIDDLALEGELDRVLGIHAGELVAWGRRSVARQWLHDVTRTLEAERALDIGSTALTQAVAANLFKLCAYKDEYEVARLMTDAAALEEARAIAGSRGKITWELHPPLLRAMGMGEKIGIPQRARAGVRLLAAGRVLRGTVVDPFRWPEVRKTERRLPNEYRAVLDQLLARLNETNHAEAVAIAALPDMVRGYEDIKMASVKAYRLELAERLKGYAA